MNTFQRKMSISLFVTLVLSLEQITCLDISSGGGLGVSSSADGSMKIWQASNGELRVKALNTLLGSYTYRVGLGTLDWVMERRVANSKKCSATALQLIFGLPFVKLRNVLKLGDVPEQIGAGTVEEPGQRLSKWVVPGTNCLQ